MWARLDLRRDESRTTRRALTRLVIGLALGMALPQPVRAEESKGQPPTRQIRVNGVELSYVDQGRGVPVVFVHGSLEDYRSWQPQVDAFAERYRAVAYSRRHNYPNPPTARGNDYSAKVDAEDLAALIESLGLPPVHVVALSYGAYAALFLAVEHPRLVRSLVLCEPPVLRWLPDLPGGPALFSEFMTRIWQPAAQAFSEGDEAGLRATIDGFGEVGYLLGGEKATWAGVPLEFRKPLLENAREWRALTESKDAFPALTESAVKGIRAPTLLLGGERSMPLNKLIDARLSSLLPYRERIVLAEASHEMWNEKPEECRKAALAFLAAH